MREEYHFKTISAISGEEQRVNGENRVRPGAERAGLGWFSIPRNRKNVVRFGFAVVIGLLVLSMSEAYRIQRGFSAETGEIYRRHLKQDDLLANLRRTVWMGGSAARDFLLNPHANRSVVFTAQLRNLRMSSERLVEGLEGGGIQQGDSRELRAKVREFWEILSRFPLAAAEEDADGRFHLVQSEIVPRRNAIGDLLRDLAKLDNEALKRSEAAFSGTRSQATHRLLLILAISMVMALGVAVYSFTHSERLELRAAKHLEEVERARTEMRDLANRLMEVQEEERTRLSRELHDEVGQALATLGLEVARAESLSQKSFPELAGRLGRARELAERVVESVRDTSLLLRPSLLDDLGLGAALEWLIEDFTRRTGVPCDFSCPGLEGQLPESLKTCIYRVLQESLHNCEKHAGASRVSVAIRRSGGQLTVTVEDDGLGFVVRPWKWTDGRPRFGLLGMRERAVALGGELEIETAPAAGTRLSFRVPLPAEDMETDWDAASREVRLQR